MFSDAESAGADTTAGTYSQGYEASVNTRGLVFIESSDPAIGMVCVIPIGITEISSVSFSVKQGDKVEKGNELGFNRVGRRVWWIPTHASPSSNRTGGFPASGSRRLFAGLLHERAYAVCCDDLPCSWLAGIGSAAGSELPLPFSGTVGVTIPFGPSPRSLSALDSSAQLPLLRSTPLSGASRLL